MLTLQEYIKDIRSKGKLIFSTSEAILALGISRAQLYNSVYRLRKKGELVSPFQGIYVPVPPEYRPIGCLPPNELIPLLMEYLDLPYYVGILSAAKYHGASHQKPMEFQMALSQ